MERRLNRKAFPLFQNLRKEVEEKAAGYGGRYHVGYWFGKKCGICSEQSRQQNQSGKEDELPKAEQKSASFTFPRAVVSSTSGYCTARGIIIKVNRLM